MSDEEILLIANPEACGGKAKIVFDNYVKFLNKNGQTSLLEFFSLYLSVLPLLPALNKLAGC